MISGKSKSHSNKNHLYSSGYIAEARLCEHVQWQKLRQYNRSQVQTSHLYIVCMRYWQAVTDFLLMLLKNPLAQSYTNLFYSILFYSFCPIPSILSHPIDPSILSIPSHPISFHPSFPSYLIPLIPSILPIPFIPSISSHSLLVWPRISSMASGITRNGQRVWIDQMRVTMQLPTVDQYFSSGLDDSKSLSLHMSLFACFISSLF